MTRHQNGQGAAAARLFATASANTEASDRFAAEVGTVCAQLTAGLSRWIGAEGYRALLGRALDETRAAHPMLEGMQCDGSDAAEVASAVEAHGTDAVAAAFVALVTSLIELLGRIVGVEMATRLVEQAGAAGAAPGSIEGKGGQHE